MTQKRPAPADILLSLASAGEARARTSPRIHAIRRRHRRGGPAGLSAACRLAQLAADAGRELDICLVEKGSEIGAHILSGAVLAPRALNELFPDAHEQGAPLGVPVREDLFYYLVNDTNRILLPSWTVPKESKNKGNFTLSLGNLCRWLGERAEEAGVNVFPGFAASEILYHDGSVKGIATADMGVGADGEPKATFEPGYELHGAYTIFAEGCRGHLGKQLMAKFDLASASTAQHYAIGLKELWDVPPEQHHAGRVLHNVGWPLGRFRGPGMGSFLYHQENHQVSLGLIVDLAYRNPHLSPFDELQRLKHHPLYAATLAGGTRVSYGARAIVKGGLQALPKLSVPGALIVGDDAGFLNMLKIKGTHTAMKSGMLAAESVFDALVRGDAHTELADYRGTGGLVMAWQGTPAGAQRRPWVAQARPPARLGLCLCRSDHRSRSHAVHAEGPRRRSRPAVAPPPKRSRSTTPKPDRRAFFRQALVGVSVQTPITRRTSPATSPSPTTSCPYATICRATTSRRSATVPAGVYEVVPQDGGLRFQINAQNCVHCKTCDIKDPAQNINWVTPEGAGGPETTRICRLCRRGSLARARLPRRSQARTWRRHWRC